MERLNFRTLKYRCYLSSLWCVAFTLSKVKLLMAVTYVQKNSSLFYIVVTLVFTVGDTNQDITTEQETAEELIEEC